MFDTLKTGNLLSIGQLCNHHCFDKQRVTIRNVENKTILVGPRDQRTGLWTVDIPTSTQPKAKTTNLANGALSTCTTQCSIALYHHASLGYPAPSTLIATINKGFLTTFPGLTSNLV
jgi:hypothetical protein